MGLNILAKSVLIAVLIQYVFIMVAVNEAANATKVDSQDANATKVDSKDANAKKKVGKAAAKTRIVGGKKYEEEMPEEFKEIHVVRLKGNFYCVEGRQCVVECSMVSRNFIPVSLKMRGHDIANILRRRRYEDLVNMIAVWIYAGSRRYHGEIVDCSSIYGRVRRRLSTTVAPNPPKFPSGSIVQANIPTPIRCVSNNGLPVANITLYINNKPQVAQSLDIRNSDNTMNATVEIIRIWAHTHDGTTIECRMIHPYLNITITAYLKLHVVSAISPGIEIPKTKYSVNRFTNLTIICKINPPWNVFITWWKNGVLVINPHIDLRPEMYGSLIIDRVRLRDEGTYICCATSNGGKIVGIPIQLDVKYSATVQQFPKLVLTKEGERIKLSCIYKDYKPAVTNVTWVHKQSNTRRIVTESKQIQIPMTVGRSDLIIAKVKFSDAGTYICEVTNAAGTGRTTNTTQVAVLTKPKLTTAKGPIQAYKGRDSKVLCNIQAYPPITQVQWFQIKGNKTTKIKYSEHFHGGSLKNPSPLTIKSVTEDDYAEYVCEAVNELGSGKSESVTLEVGDWADPQAVKGSDTDSGDGGLWAGVILVIILVISAILLTIYYYKKRHANKVNAHEVASVEPEAETEPEAPAEPEPEVKPEPEPEPGPEPQPAAVEAQPAATAKPT